MYICELCLSRRRIRRASRYVTSLNLLNDRPSNSRTVLRQLKLPSQHKPVLALLIHDIPLRNIVEPLIKTFFIWVWEQIDECYKNQRMVWHLNLPVIRYVYVSESGPILPPTDNQPPPGAKMMKGVYLTTLKAPETWRSHHQMSLRLWRFDVVIRWKLQQRYHMQ